MTKTKTTLEVRGVVVVVVFLLFFIGKDTD